MAAASKSANLEAIDQFRRGLALVEALSDMRERAARELDFQMALGPALYATRSYSPWHESCRDLAKTSSMFPPNWRPAQERAAIFFGGTD
jgi:hypothetical protein